ncbi:MAG: type IV pili twitching motility protein PilT [Halobacteriovorax sp.]|nr:type IV pili twitching motility protein PilT [Halobacteriovorax sp.]|tara:strand:- start:159493 stop:160686 length:1194 start_codon:yes stop_codon:yes gene_type:complete
MPMDKETFHKLLKSATVNGVSDIHLREGEFPYFRMKGGLKKIKASVLTKEDMKNICKVIIQDQEILKDLDKIKEYDGSYQLGKICRVRVNLLKFQGKIAIIMRVITMQVPTMEQLGLPKALVGFVNAKRGLVLVTGVTGSGKSSTLASIIQEINRTREEHILTIEDPVEFIFTSEKCRITQRELGADTDSFKDALRGALRQDPDIIVIGELRDAETIQISMKAAETGHLVFGTVHTTNAPATINRIVSMFPPEEQDNVKLRLSECLFGSISQRLLPTLDGKGRVCAQEIMVNKVGIQDCISGKEPLSNMYVTIEKSKGEMQSFDQHLTKLYREEMITYDVAIGAASSPTNFERNLEFGGNDESEEEEENVSPIKNQAEEGETEEESSNGELSLDIAK